MDLDLDARLRRHLGVADTFPVAPADIAGAAASARRRLVRRRQAGTAILVAVLLAAGITATRGRRHTLEVGTPPATTATTVPAATVPAATVPAETVPAATVAPTASPAPPSIGAWTPIAPDPRGPTLAPAVATTGASVLAVGGRDSDGVPRAGAAEYVPATDQWRQLPDPPDHLGRADLLAISAGQEVLVLGGTAADGRPVATDLAVDPATGTWRTLASRPGGSISANSPAVWTGHELLVWPGDGGVGALPGPLGYDPATDVWRQLPAPPVAGRQHAASVWTGSEWILWGGTTGSAELADGAAYDPATDTWRTLAAAPLAGRKVRAAWTGVEMIVAAGSSGGDPVTGNGEFAFGDAAAYDPASDSWRALAAGFAHPGFQPVWTGGRVVMFAKSGAVIYDPTTDAWTDDCCDSTWFQSTPIALDGRALLVGSSDPTDGGAFYDPARAAGTAPPTETT